MLYYFIYNTIITMQFYTKIFNMFNLNFVYVLFRCSPLFVGF